MQPSKDWNRGDTADLLRVCGELLILGEISNSPHTASGNRRHEPFNVMPPTLANWITKTLYAIEKR
jgi:hypothetical protein